MKRFLITLSLFLLPLLAFICISEPLLRNIPNDYKNKRIYLDENADRLSVLILGHSHALTGLNPDYFSQPCFNAAYVSQTIDMDAAIFEKYKSRLNHLEYIILPMSYCTMSERLETTPEFWRIKNYVLYYKMNLSGNIRDHSEIFGNKLRYNLRRMVNYYVLQKNPIVCSSKGWEKRTYQKNIDLVRSGKERALLHTINDPVCFSENARLLETFIRQAAEKNIRIIFYTSPAYTSYVQNMNPVLWKQTLDFTDSLIETYPNVSYHNFLTDPAFTETDYFDADHLNIVGAKKLSLLLNEQIIIYRDKKPKSYI
jgi:hypothetical protein